MPKTTTTCSGCSATVKITDDAVTVDVPSNGRRGSLHVAAHTLTAEDAYVTEDGMVCWTCPVCGYADSYDEASA
jgi:hypothetical protein